MINITDIYKMDTLFSDQDRGVDQIFQPIVDFISHSKTSW